MVRLVANERFTYCGQCVEVDSEFDALDDDAAVLTHEKSPRARYATTSFSDSSYVHAMNDRPRHAQSKKNKYSRRDLRAED